MIKKKICSDPLKIKSKFLNIVNIMKSDLTKLNRIKKRKFCIYTLSLGSLFGLIIADYIKVEKMAMVVPIYGIAETFWNRNKKDTNNIKSFFQRKNFDLKKLRKIWSELSLKDAFNKHSLRTKFLLRLSRDDVYLPFNIKRKLLLLLKKKNIKFISEQRIFSHKLSGVIDALFPSRIVKFFTA